MLGRGGAGGADRGLRPVAARGRGSGGCARGAAGPGGRGAGRAGPAGVASSRSTARRAGVGARDEMPHTRGAFRRVGSPSGGRCCWPGRPPACRGRTGPRSTGGSPAIPMSSRGWATARSSASARELAYELDPVSFVERRRRAEARPPRLPASRARRDEPALRRCCRSRTASPSGRCSAARPIGHGRRRPALARPDHGRHPGAPRPAAQGRAHRQCR